HVYLVFHHVVKLQHVHDANRDRLCKWFTRTAVEENAFAVWAYSCLFELALDFFIGSTCERRNDSLVAKHVSREAEMELEDLTEVHTRWNAERGQYDVYRITVFIERHVFFWENAGDNAFVSVAAGELVTD